MDDLKLNPAPDYPMSAYIDLGQKEKIESAKIIMSKSFQDKNKEILEQNNLSFKIQNSLINDNCVLLMTICVLNEKGQDVTNLFRWN